MQKGSIKFYNKVKGWGFLTSESGDVFFHFSNLVNENDKDTLKDGDLVEFEVVHGQRGPAAEKVLIIK